MIKNLIKLASYLDSKGLTKEADFLDKIILKTSGITPDGNYDEDYLKPVSNDEDYEKLDQISQEIYYDQKEEYNLDTAKRFLKEIKNVSKNPLVNEIPEPTDADDDRHKAHFEYSPSSVWGEKADEDLMSLASKISSSYRHLADGPFYLESRNYKDMEQGTKWMIEGLELASALGLGKDLDFAYAAMRPSIYDLSGYDLSEEKSEAGDFEGDVGADFSPNSDIAEDLTIDSDGLSDGLPDPFVETWGKNGKVSVTSVIEKLKEFSEDIEMSVEFGMDEADRFGYGGDKEEIARDAAEELGVDYRYIEHFDDNKWYSESKDEEEKKECIHEDLLKEMSKYQDN